MDLFTCWRGNRLHILQPEKATRLQKQSFSVWTPALISGSSFIDHGLECGKLPSTEPDRWFIEVSIFSSAQQHFFWLFWSFVLSHHLPLENQLLIEAEIFSAPSRRSITKLQPHPSIGSSIVKPLAHWGQQCLLGPAVVLQESNLPSTGAKHWSMQVSITPLKPITALQGLLWPQPFQLRFNSRGWRLKLVPFACPASIHFTKLWRWSFL